MKLFPLLLVLALTAGLVHADPGSILKQRARDVAAPNRPSGPPGPPPPSATPNTPAARPKAPDPVASLRHQLAIIVAAPQPAPEHKSNLAANLRALARGSRQPAIATFEKLADLLATALPGRALDANAQGRLAQKLNLLCNSASLSAERTAEVTAEIQALLADAGLPAPQVAAVTGQLEKLVGEIQSP
jgi:hypothetical protein